MVISEETLRARALFGQRLNKLLRSRDMNQNELAKILDVSESTVGKWVLGKSMPRTMGLVQKIADYFGVGKSFLLESAPPVVKPVKEEYSQHEKDILSAYRAAPSGTKKIVDVALEDYMPGIKQEDDDAV